MRCGGGFVRSGDVFALAEVVRGLARCGRRSEVRLPPSPLPPARVWKTLRNSSGDKQGRDGYRKLPSLRARRQCFRAPPAPPLEQVTNYQRHAWTRATIGVILYRFLAEMFLTDGTPQLSNELLPGGIPRVQQYCSLARRQRDCLDR